MVTFSEFLIVAVGPAPAYIAAGAFIESRLRLLLRLHGWLTRVR